MDIAAGIPTLTTPRLVLRPFVVDDLDELAPIHAEESFWWYPLRPGMSREETAGFLERVAARYDSDGFGIEALLDRASGAMIGWAGLAVPHFLPEILPAVEVGWRLASASAWSWTGDRGRRRRGGVRFTTAASSASSDLRAAERGVGARMDIWCSGTAFPPPVSAARRSW